MWHQLQPCVCRLPLAAIQHCITASCNNSVLSHLLVTLVATLDIGVFIDRQLGRSELAVACRYQQAGTPKLEVSTSYDSSAQTYTISTKQSTPTTSGQNKKQPVMLPLAVSLFSKDGHEMPLTLKVPSAFISSESRHLQPLLQHSVPTCNPQLPLPTLHGAG